MREFIDNPLLPIITRFKEDPKSFWFEFLQLLFMGSIALFLFIFIPVFSFLLALHCFNG